MVLEKYFKNYRPFLLFLLKFLGCYVILILFYQMYLNQFDPKVFETDGFTSLVASQTKTILLALGFNVELIPHLSEPSMRVLINGKAIVRIVEGCNAISIMILFVSFIISFSGKFWQTITFVFLGLLLIHVLNVFRIVLLTIGLLYHKKYEHLMHDIIFPLFIYGVVFGLWILWVNKFSKNVKKSVTE